MSQRDVAEVEVEAEASLSAASQAVFLEKVRQSNSACQSGDFATAVSLYTEALSLDPANPVLFSNRSAAHIKLGRFNNALQDAIKARELNPKWPKAYYRQGVALQCLGRHADALAAFSSGLAQDPTSSQLLAGLVEAAMKSPLRATLEPTYRQLQLMRLDKSAFVVISVIGQELLASNHGQAAVVVLESALKVGTCSLKLRGSVFSALSSAYWALNSLDKAIAYMQQDLAVAKSLGDIAGECRAHGNLGSAYFSKGNYKEALTSHRYQLVLAMKCKDTHAAAAALTSLGHVYTAIGDYPNALASHKQCVQLVKQIGDRLQEAREIGNVGAVYLATGDFDSAVDCHLEHLRIAQQLGNKVEEARAYSNLGSSHHYKRNFDQAVTFHNHVLRLAKELGDKTIEARAYAGLGHAGRCIGDYPQAKKWHELQLDMALVTKDKVSEGRALSNLGIVYQLLGDHDAALKLHQAHLSIARELDDRAGMGRAYGNIGNAYSTMGRYEQAVKYHKQELTISKEVNDRSSEAATHGNLAVAYQAMGMCEMALLHYHSHLGVARELKDAGGEACALLNLGNCHSSRGEFAQAVPFYEQYLMLSQELHDLEGEAKACHFLGYAHYCLGNYKEAIRYYEQDLALAKDLQDKASMSRAYCNLGLAHLALDGCDTALECQKYFLALAHTMKNMAGKLRALANIGDTLLRMSNTEEAIQVYQKQLLLSKQSGEKGYEAAAYGALGLAHRSLRCYDKAVGYHTQELTLRQESGDARGECRAHGNLGAIHMSLGHYTQAIKCYEEQLERARELSDCQPIESQALGNLGIARLNMAHYEDAIGYFEQQLATLEHVTCARSGGSILLDKGRSFGNLGDCYDALGDYDEAIKCQEQYLSYALQAKSVRDQERAYRGLGKSQRANGYHQEALVCFEKRLVAAHELDSPAAKASAYGELGQVHRTLGNYEQAASCLQHQLAIACEVGDAAAEAEAASGLGRVCHETQDYSQALRYHRMDLTLSERAGFAAGQCRAYGNLAATFEAMSDFAEAVHHREQHLSLAAQLNDRASKTDAYSSLGRLHLAMGRVLQAISYLIQGLATAEQTGNRDDEAAIRHRLGLALWRNGDLEGAKMHLERSAAILETSHNKKQSGCLHALQRVHVALGNTDDALLVAEKGRSRKDCGFSSIDQMMDTVNRQKASILYYSLAGNRLHCWLLMPHRGIVGFTESCIGDGTGDKEEEEGDVVEDWDVEAGDEGGLDSHLQSLRDALGVEFSGVTRSSKDPDNDVSDQWSQPADETSDKQDGDRFLRMASRNHLYNSSSYSLSSLFSVGSVGGSVASVGSTSRAGSTRGKGRAKGCLWQGPASLRTLYQMLVEPMEEHLPGDVLGTPDLVLIVEGRLHLIPFALLRRDPTCDYLSERFNLICAPSLSFLRWNQRARLDKMIGGGLNSGSGDRTSALVVGNPRLPPSLLEQYGFGDLPQAEQEANTVADILQTKPLIGVAATKEAVCQQAEEVECVHLATHVSWSLPGVALSPGEMIESRPKRFFGEDLPAEEGDPPTTDGGGGEQLLTPSDFMLTLSDLREGSVKVGARLVVISSCHTRDRRHGGAAREGGEGVEGLVGAFLQAGAQCVLVALWPVPDTAVKIFYRTFYSSLLQGSRASRALSEAMQTVQNTKHFSHPANWAGFVLIGSDIKLSNKVALMGQALCDLVKMPDRCRDALRVTLHLVEKSLQRIHRGHKNAMYTTQKSIENKVGDAQGWKDLLISVGFRFEPSANGIPSSVFFPQSDPADRLTQCSASLQALLGLSGNSLHALCKLLLSPEVAEDVTHVMRRVMAQFNMKDSESDPVEVAVGVKLWRVPGCHELLASLGFDLMAVGQDEVMLRTGKQANRRNIQFALQALLALFDTQEAPRSLSLGSSSSLESLESLEKECMGMSGHASSPPPVLPPPNSSSFIPTPRKMAHPLVLGAGAFTSYVRRRGEPDGRTAGGSDGGGGGSKVGARDRDNPAFTAGPLDGTAPKAKLRRQYTAAPSTSNSNSENTVSRPASSSSTSSATDWENGQGTVRRQVVAAGTGTKKVPPLPPPRTSITRTLPEVPKITLNSGELLDRLCVRTQKRCEAEVKLGLSLRPLPSLGGVEAGVESSGGAAASTAVSRPFEEGEAESSIQERIVAAQMRRLNRDLPIAEVYHERSLGLGLAPPLSKLLANGGKGLADTPETMKEAKTFTAMVTSPAPDDPQSSSSSSSDVANNPPPRSPPSPLPGWPPPRLRDEGDGRSMTDSQRSGFAPAPNRIPLLTPRSKNVDPIQGVTSSKIGAAMAHHLTPAIHTSQIAEYLDQVMLRPGVNKAGVVSGQQDSEVKERRGGNKHVWTGKGKAMKQQQC